MIWLVSLIALAQPTYLLRLSIFGVPTTVLEVLIYTSFIGLLGARPLAQIVESSRHLFRHFAPALIFLVIGLIVGLFASEDTKQALGLIKAYFIDPVLFLLVMTTILTTREKLSYVLWSLLIGGALVGLGALVIPVTIEGRALGLYSLDAAASPNFMALFLAPLVPLAVYETISARSVKIRLVATLVTLLISYGLLASGSRGGLMAAGFGLSLLIVWLAMLGKNTFIRRLGRFGLLLLIIGTLVGGYLVAKPDFSKEPAHRVATSNNLRYEIWKTTIVDIIPEHWLMGTGIGNFQKSFTESTKHRINYPEYIAPWALTPHNIFLTIWVNLGIFGLLGLIWLLVLFFKIGWSKTKQPSLTMALQISMITLLVHGLVDSPYWKNDLALLFWIVIGLQYSLSLLPKDSHA